MTDEGRVNVVWSPPVIGAVYNFACRPFRSRLYFVVQVDYIREMLSESPLICDLRNHHFIYCMIRYDIIMIVWYAETSAL